MKDKIRQLVNEHKGEIFIFGCGIMIGVTIACTIASNRAAKSAIDAVAREAKLGIRRYQSDSD